MTEVFATHFSRVLYAPLSAASRELWRHEDHQTGCRLADLLRGPAKRNIQQASFTMTAQDQQLSFDGGRHLDNDVPRIARAQDGRDLQALGVERRHVGVQFVDHEGIGPPPQIILMPAGHLRGEIPHGEGG